MSISTMTVTERKDFISSLELREPYPEIARLVKDGIFQIQASTAVSDTTAANIDSGSLMSFTAEVSSEHRSAALNSSLLAQLNSDKLYNRFDKNQIMDWYKNYQKVLGICGFVLQDFQFQNYEASGSTFSIDKAIISIVTTFLLPPQILVVEGALSALEKLKSDDPWYKVWDQSSHSTNGGNFQISLASDISGLRNSLVVKISAYSFQTMENTSRFLWTDYHSSSTKLSYATQEITLDEDLYDKLRETIIKKLGDKIKSEIGDLDI